MLVKITELKKNIDKYLDLSQKEDIFITKHGKVISTITKPNKNKIEITQSLFGVISLSENEDKLLKERISKI